MIKHLDELVAAAVARGKKKMIVAYGQDTHSIGATDMAIKAGLADVTLVGDPEEIKKSCEAEGVDMSQYTIIPETEDVKAVEIAVKAVHNGEYDVLMKGVVPTDKYMRGILNKEWGLLPQGTVLSHVTVLEVPAYHKLLVRRYFAICFFCSKDGQGRTATSLTTRSLWYAGTSNTVTWLRTVPAGNKPHSLFKIPRIYLSVGTTPFIKTSYSPL